MMIGFATGAVASACVGGAIWMVVQCAPTNEAPARLPDTARRERAEKFFGGDPNRNVRGGQEMRPRW